MFNWSLYFKNWTCFLLFQTCRESKLTSCSLWSYFLGKGKSILCWRWCFSCCSGYWCRYRLLLLLIGPPRWSLTSRLLMTYHPDKVHSWLIWDHLLVKFSANVLFPSMVLWSVSVISSLEDAQSFMQMSSIYFFKM